MSKRNAARIISKEMYRFSQFTEFMNQVAKSAGCANVDHYLRSGQILDAQKAKELGAHFLKIAMGFDDDEFIPFIGGVEDPNFVPQSEDYYPWAFYSVPTTDEDLMEVFHKRAMQYLLSDGAGKKNYVIICNFRSLIVCDLKHYVADYDISFSDLHDAIGNGDSNSKTKNALQAWKNLLEDFGPESSREKKKQRRADVVKYIEPKDDRLGFVKRFGHMPDFQKPIGWDGKEFRETFKTKDLPFLTTEEFDWDGSVKKNENRLIWGDNLSVMRSLASESIDLIYIDPPFFSGRNYNCIFGDDDEIRTFNDIWDGGLPTYLAWMNARLWEMKRLLKNTGSICVHLDWHAASYVKCELDKIFGYGGDKDEPGFKNQIIWHYTGGGRSKNYFSRKHDYILWYTKTGNYTFNIDDIRVPYKETSGYAKGGITGANGKKYQPNPKGTPMDDVWDIPIINPLSHERIGYPTQKPENLLEIIVKGLSNKGDVVADFFSGGGSTIAVAEKLNRRWIGCDVSRIAVSVARDRVQSIYRSDTGIERINEKPTVGFSVQNHGAYDKANVRQLEEKKYTNFILQCYEAVPERKGDYIHGLKMGKAVHVAPSKGKVSVDLIEEFHVELSQKKIESGVILAWSWDKDAESYIDELRSGHHGPEIQLIQVKLVDIDSHEFKEDNIRFLNKPAAVVRYKHNKGLNFVFDGTASQGRNDTDIHYYQWDFNYKNRFNPMTKPNFGKDNDGDGNPLNDNRKVEYEFPSDGAYRVALRIVDKAGAEDTHVIEFDTKEARGKKAA